MVDCSIEVASAIAAIVSAIGGAFAAIGAMRSASSARGAQAAASRSEKRVAIRESVVATNELRVELERVQSRAADLKLGYRSLFRFSGSSNHSSEKLLVSVLEEKVSAVQELAASVAPVSNDIGLLYDASLDDINKRYAQVQQSLVSVRSIREDIEREQSSVEAQCAAYRERALQK